MEPADPQSVSIAAFFGSEPTVSQIAKPFLTDVTMLRERARQHIMEGAVTEAYSGDTEVACRC